MGSLNKKIRDNNDKRTFKEMFGKEPKHRCPVCHRFSLFDHKDTRLNAFKGCIMCYLIDQTRKERANEEGRDNRPSDTGE